MRKFAWTVPVAVAAVVAAGCSGSGSGSESGSGSVCDRACLVDIADRYLAALAAHDPGAVPFAGEVAFVENLVPLAPGEGLWATAAGPATGYRIVVPDPDAGAVGMISVIDRESADGVAMALLAVRLAVEDSEIVEAEHIVADLTEEADRSRLVAPRANLVAVVPEGQRQPRAELAAIAGAYYDGLVASDAALVPFAADCERFENGMVTAGAGLPPTPFASVDVAGRSPPPVARDCIGQMSSRRFAYIDSIDNRRVFAVDPVQGLAMGLSHFRQSMSRGPQRLIAADGSELMWEERREPYDLPAAHVFKIAGGQIHEVEAIGIFVPYASATGWE